MRVIGAHGILLKSSYHRVGTTRLDQALAANYIRGFDLFGLISAALIKTQFHRTSLSTLNSTIPLTID